MLKPTKLLLVELSSTCSTTDGRILSSYRKSLPPTRSILCSNRAYVRPAATKLMFVDNYLQHFTSEQRHVGGKVESQANISSAAAGVLCAQLKSTCKCLTAGLPVLCVLPLELKKVGGGAMCSMPAESQLGEDFLNPLEVQFMKGKSQQHAMNIFMGGATSTHIFLGCATNTQNACAESLTGRVWYIGNTKF